MAGFIRRLYTRFAPTLPALSEEVGAAVRGLYDDLDQVFGEHDARLDELEQNGTTVTGGTGGSGDVTGPASSTDNALARYDGTTGKLIQNSGATVDDSGNIAATNLSGTNTGDQTITLTGDVTGSGSGSFAATIGANKVTDAKLRQSSALSVIGRSANSTGDVADISGSASSDAVLRVSGTSLGFGTVATAGIANSAVTLAKIANAAANSKLLGSGASGSGSAYSELSLGTGMSVSGTTVSSPIRLDLTAAVLGTAETLLGSVYLPSGAVIRSTSIAYIGGQNSGQSACLRLRRATNGALLASFTATTTALANTAMDGGANVTVSTSDWYNITLAALVNGQIAVSAGLQLE